MKQKLFFAALAVSILAACSEKLEEVSVYDEGQMVNLEISLEPEGVALSKVAYDGSMDDVIENFRLFIFDENNVLEKTMRTTVSAEVKTFTVGMFCGPKTIYAIANEKDENIADISTFEDYCSRVSTLANGAFVMEGSCSVTITPQIQSVKIPVRRLVSKIKLESIEQNLQGAYSGEPFQINEVYLINYVSAVKYHGEDYVPVDADWCSKREYNGRDQGSSLTTASLNVQVLEAGVRTSVNKSLYCYPNPTIEDSVSETWCPRHTRLVLKAVVGTKHFYYPITLPVLKSNTQYAVSLKITGPGTDSPDKPYNPSAASVEVKPVPWTNAERMDIVI